MANYYEQTVIQQTIPDADMTPLERLLLSQIFQSEPIGDGWYLFAEENPCTMIVVNRSEIEAALAETTDTGSSAPIYVTKQLAGLADVGEDIDLDLSGTSWAFLLQDIVKRSNTLDYISVATAFTCSKMRPDGFGGMAVLITPDAIVGKSTNDILEDLLAEHPSSGTENRTHVLLRLEEEAVRKYVRVLIETYPPRSELTVDAVTDDDIRAACIALIAKPKLARQRDALVIEAAMEAVRQADRRLTAAG